VGILPPIPEQISSSMASRFMRAHTYFPHLLKNGMKLRKVNVDAESASRNKLSTH
jgi:hypothetical protein